METQQEFSSWRMVVLNGKNCYWVAVVLDRSENGKRQATVSIVEKL